MRAFEVSLNGKKLCLAGIGDDGVLTAIVNWVPRRGEGDLFLEVAGLISPKDEHVTWIKQKALHVGDQVQLKVVEKSAVDRSSKKKQRIDPKEKLRLQKRYVRMMAKELGWTIQTQPKRSNH